MSITVAAYATQSATENLAPFSIERRTPEKDDVSIDILYCGVCHSDLHYARNDWNFTIYPAVPGHEIVGRVAGTGSEVTSFKTGDLVAVGCLVDSCRTCASCEEGLEQYCDQGAVMTYGSLDYKRGKQPTLGGYAKNIVVNEGYVLRMPENLNPAAAAPLLCAGITTWSPLKEWNVGPGMTVGVIGLGGLGHMGVKFAHAMGARVVMITTSPDKGNDAMKLGADDVLISSDKDAMKAQRGKFDFLLDTIPVGHSLNPYLLLLKRDATLAIVGAIEPMDGFHAGMLLARRRRIVGSSIGGIKETQEMLDFCAANGVVSDIEMISIDNINEAYERMLNNDVKYRFVIDMASLK
ncbi:MAG: NAD(P)-dependent alcohol dehydrogenase [Arenicella sp.]|nr:NAD(P)-dependent alcohol dehydrogenase [Arenicella sp.]